MATQSTDKQLENAYLAAEQLKNNIASQVRGLENKLLEFIQLEQNAAIIYSQDPSNVDKANTVVVYRIAIQQTQEKLNHAKIQLSNAEQETEAAYQSWLNWKKDNLSPDELGEFLQIQQTIQEEKALTEQKLNSNSFYQKYKQTMFVGLGVVAFLVFLFFVYRYIKSKTK